MVIELVVSFLCGSALTVAVILAAVLLWFYSQPLAVNQSKASATSYARTYIPPKSPVQLEEVCERLKNSPDGLGDESCVWFNLIVDFVFKELRDTPRIKRLVMKKIEKEFQELLLTKTEGRLLEQLTVREYSLGVSMPVITSASVIKVERSDDEAKNIEEIEIALEVEYTGECEMAIDADLLFNKAAYVAIQVKQVRGRGRLKFTRRPVTSWSFTFYEEPYLDLKVDSHFEGRDFPQLSSFIEAQCRKYVRRKHTLPASKTRYKPFFQKHKPQNQLLDLHVHDHRLTVGELTVVVVKCSRLPHFDGAQMVYCTVEVAEIPWKPVIHLWKTQWPVLEFVVSKTAGQAIGMKNRKVVYAAEDESNVFILVSDIISQSAADTAGLKKGDIVTKVNNVKINSVKQVTRLINKTKGKSVLVTVNRPPAHFSMKLLQSEFGEFHSSSSTAANLAGDGVSIGETLRNTNASSRTGAQDGTSLHTDRGNNAALISSEEHTGEGDCLRLGHIDVDRDRGASASVSTEDGSITEQREGRQLRKRHSPAKMTSGDETSLCSDPGPEEPVTVDHSHDGVLSEPSSPTSIHSLSQPLRDGNSEITTQSQDADTSDSTSAQQTTRAIPICKNPVWNQKYSFELGENHSYVNICVWVKLSEEKGNLLVGHVTLSLTDIALECLCTSSGTHQQNYVLVAAENAKAIASRAALQATSTTGGKGLKDEKIFAGDVLLRFRHVPSCVSDNHNEGNQQTDAVHGLPQHNLHRPSDPSEANVPSDHHFIAVEVDGLHRKCDICLKKIWTLKSKVQECQKCGIKCHKKCMEYCMQLVPCRERPVHLQQRSEGDFTVYECENEDEDASGGNGHRLLDQQRKRINSVERSSFVVVDAPEHNSSEENKDKPKSGEDINPHQEDAVSFYSCSQSDSENTDVPEEVHSMSWYPNLPEREQTLKEKMTVLQQEIERINNLIREEKGQERPDISPAERQRIQDRVVHYEEKLTPLNLLMVQLNVELGDNSCEYDSSIQHSIGV